MSTINCSEIDFLAMTRRVVATGMVAAIDRRASTDQGECRSEVNMRVMMLIAELDDERDKLRNEHVDLFHEFIAAMFPLLVEIGSSSTCVNLRYDCVRVMLRMVCAVQCEEQLRKFLQEISLAAFIASTLSSSKYLALLALAIQVRKQLTTA